MLGPLVWVLIFLPAVAGAFSFTDESPRHLSLSAGVGLQSRLEREINPDFVKSKNSGQLFAQVLYLPYVLNMELGREEGSSRMGGLTITHSTVVFTAWGRYEWASDSQWRPFAAVGGGCYFDEVVSRFDRATDERSGTRLLSGLGAGVRGLLGHLLRLEAEGRMAFVQDHKDPEFSGTVKVGFEFSAY